MLNQQRSSRFCFEALYNKFHLYGIAKCPMCRDLINVPPTANFYILNRKDQKIKSEAIETDFDKQSVVQDAEHYLNQTDERLQQTNLYEQCKDCSCCHGFVLDCEGELCQLLGYCNCYGMLCLEEDQGDETQVKK